jgi:hypothetical protein
MKFAVHKSGSGTILHAGGRAAGQVAMPGYTGLLNILEQVRLS